MPEPPALATCGREALTFCDPPVPGRSDRLGDTEVDDDDNRALWLTCVERHRGAVLCLRRIYAAGGVVITEEVRDP